VTPREAPRHVPGLTPRLRARLQRFFAVATRISPPLAARLALQLFVTPPRRRIEAQDIPTLARALRQRLKAGSFEAQAFLWSPDPRPTRSSVLLLHGWGSHAPRFGSFVAPLHAAGYRVIGLDAPAHGDAPGRTSDLPRFRAALEAALAEFAPITSVVAHSLGASATVWVVAERGRLGLESIVLIGMPRDLEYVMESFELLLGLRADVRAALRRAFAIRFGTEVSRFSAHELANRLNLPVLVVHDEDDDVAPFDHALGFAERLAHGRIHATRGLAHSGALRDRATIERIAEFIQAHDTQREAPR
jgi:pimeloyl-ACP methyl ester carboxylesterase